MDTKKPITLQEINQVIEYTIWDVFFAQDFYFMLSKVVRPLLKDAAIKKTYSATLECLKNSLDIAYIITLYKLFDKRGLGLVEVINQTKRLKDSKEVKINIKKYNKFLAKADQYIEKINSIEANLNLLRNKFRAHNFPERKGDDSLLSRTKVALHFAEKIYDEIGAVRRLPKLCSAQKNTQLRFEMEEFLKGLKNGRN
ncbi:MAG: hypothetical protein H8E54_07970 [Candidatus Aminicenantes bacterium]|nr:hypothetical protein [Candidatus Aminicenantes bacterium]MBL7151792.1 hypothetical protein [Candidatus Omnitrophota bacterium]